MNDAATRRRLNAILAGALAASACGPGSSDPCAGVACNGRGFCLADQGTAYCACLIGYHPVGLECRANDADDPCLGVDCSGRGSCRVAAEVPVCDCLTGYRHPDPASPACAEGQCELLCIREEPPDGGVDTAGDADADADADVLPGCGNGLLETGEECDDGNRIPLDGCENDCTASCRAAAECDDLDPCTSDDCTPLGGGAASCTHAVAAGATCDDGDPCTTGETCDTAGACAGGTSICACAVTADCAVFEDGDACNGTLVCVGRACEVDPLTVVTCSTSGDTTCRRNVCASATGLCAYQSTNEGAACDDGQFCTTTDRCAGGACVGSGNPCPSGPCSVGCDEGRDRCTLLAAGTTCRAATGDCDVAETCDGTAADCPSDRYEPASTVCEASAGPCDVAETCSGSSPDCPANAFHPSTYVCRPAVSGCDVEERCTGSSASCPADGHAADDTICVDDGTLCGTPKNCHVCRSGACVLNAGHWSAACLPSCGVIQDFCGIPAECCGAGTECAYGEPGGESNDCVNCCAYECCLPSQVVEYSCGDYQDNDCDGQVDCDDPDCEFRSCDGGTGYCQFGICVWT